MSSMASNYDMQRLFLGQGAAVIAIITSLAVARLSLSESINSALPFMLITVAYGIMMFASSYVEEEHHFWYWSASAWLALLGLKGFSGYVILPGKTMTKRYHNTHQSTRASSRKYYILSLMFALAATRLVRGWNQTGQKFAGDPDIVKTYINTNPVLLWCLVGAAYFRTYHGLAHGFSRLLGPLSIAGTAALTLAALSFKLAFTNEDAPELVVGAAKSIVNFPPGFTLVARAQAVFMGLGAAAVCAVYLIFSKKRASDKSTSQYTHLVP